MRKTLLSLLVNLLPILALSQSKHFTLTPGWFKDAKDTSKNYIVIETPNTSQTDLYKKSLIYFSSTYRSPQDVISKVENEVLTINGYQEGAIHENKLATPFNINYTIVFKFKDNKIKIESPSFTLEVGLRRKYLVYGGFNIDGKESGVFNKKGKVKSERALSDLENFFNTYIDRYIKAIANEKGDW